MTSQVTQLSVEQLTEAIRVATEQGGAYGQNLHPSKDVLIRVGDHQYYSVELVAVAFVGETGRFALVLQAGDPL